MSDKRPNAQEIDTSPPVDYLALPPTPAEQLLGRQVDLHDGAAVPFWMLAKVALRSWAVAVWVGRADAVAGRTRRWLIAGITIAVANLGGVGVYSIHRIQESAVAEERTAVLRATVADDRAEMLRRLAEVTGLMQRQIEELKLDVRELRLALHRLSGRDPLPGGGHGASGPDSSSWVDPDKLSLMSDPARPGRLVIGPRKESCAIY